MKLPVRTKQYFLGFMLTVIVLFKYPKDPHEYGKDSFIVHEMATHLQNLDHAPWLIHTCSAYALYPFSYAPGMAFILTSLGPQWPLNRTCDPILYHYNFLGWNLRHVHVRI